MEDVYKRQTRPSPGETRQRPSWVGGDKETFPGVLKSLRVGEELNEPMVREQYVVEYYSR